MKPVIGGTSADDEQSPDDVLPEDLQDQQGQVDEGAQDDSQQDDEPLTKAQLQKMGYLTQESLNQALQQFGNSIVQRVGQSTDARIKNQLNAYAQAVALQKQAGHEVPADVQAATRRSIIEQAYTQPELQQQAQQVDGQAMTAQQWSEFLLTQVHAVYDAIGAEVTDADPEFQMVLTEWQNPRGSPEQLMKAATKAAIAKQNRIASKSSQARARTGANGGKPTLQGDISKIDDPDVLFEMAERKIRGGRK